MEFINYDTNYKDNLMQMKGDIGGRMNRALNLRQEIINKRKKIFG